MQTLWRAFQFRAATSVGQHAHTSGLTRTYVKRRFVLYLPNAVDTHFFKNEKPKLSYYPKYMENSYSSIVKKENPI